MTWLAAWWERHSSTVASWVLALAIAAAVALSFWLMTDPGRQQEAAQNKTDAAKGAVGAAAAGKAAQIGSAATDREIERERADAAARAEIIASGSGREVSAPVHNAGMRTLCASEVYRNDAAFQARCKELGLSQ